MQAWGQRFESVILHYASPKRHEVIDMLEQKNKLSRFLTHKNVLPDAVAREDGNKA